MSTYRVEWPCCYSVTETSAWIPERCPLCEPLAPDPALLALAGAVRKWAQWVGAVHVGSPEHELFLMAKEQGWVDA